MAYHLRRLVIPVALTLTPASGYAVDAGYITDREFLLQIISDHDKQYQQRFEAQEKALTAALTSAKEAVDKANIASEKRFDSVNEFRNTLADQQRTLLPRTEYSVQHQSLADSIAQLSSRLDLIVQRQYQQIGQSEAAARLWGFAVGGIGILVAIAAAAINLIQKRKPA